MDNATAALAKMNMILHNNPTAEIWKDNTLSNPYFKNPDGTLKTFDFAVANPPFSNKAWSNGFDPANDLYDRFKGYGIPPKKNGDYAFLLHMIRSLKSKGKGAIILPHGVLFRGNAEAEIRKNIIRKGFIKGKVTKALIQKRVKEIKNDADASEEMKVLEGYLKLIEKEADANKKIKDAQTALDKKVIARYKALTGDEVKTLVVDDNWMAAISLDVKTELERISQRLTQRIKELAERYAAPLPDLNTKVEGLETKVNNHLEKMGFAL